MLSNVVLQKARLIRLRHYMAHRTTINRRHYLISGTGAFQFLKPSPAYAADESVHDTTRHDTTRIHTRDRGSELERKEANGRPADQPRIRLGVLAYYKSCRSCTTGQEREVSHTDAVLPFASVIGRACRSSVSRIYQNRSLANVPVNTHVQTCAQTWPRRRARSFHVEAFSRGWCTRVIFFGQVSSSRDDGWVER